MVCSKSVSTKQQSQQQDPDDEGVDDINIANDVTQRSEETLTPDGQETEIDIGFYQNEMLRDKPDLHSGH
nr:hypothetical protein [Tanacetum cinerariifolium]